MRRFILGGALMLTLAMPAFGAGTVVRKDPGGEGYNPCSCICANILGKVVCICLCDG
jgi:hypothetical protein